MNIIQVETSLGEKALDLIDIYKLPALVEKTGIKKVFETNVNFRYQRVKKI